MIKILFCVFFITTLHTTSFAQKDKSAIRAAKKEQRAYDKAERLAQLDRYRTPLAIYPIYWAMQDTRMTAGIYRGVGLGLTHKVEEYGAKHFIRSDFQANGGLSFPNYADGDMLINGQIYYDLTYMRPFRNQHTYLGGSFFVLYHTRYNSALSNSSLNWDLALGLGPVIRTQRSFHLFKKDNQLTFSLGIPLVSFVNRIPEYGLSFHEPANYIAPIGQFNRITFTIDLKRPYKKNENDLINWFYRWDFYAMNEQDGLHKLRIAQHQIGFYTWLKKL